MFTFLQHWMLLLAALVLILCQEKSFVAAVDDSDDEWDNGDLEDVSYSQRAASDKIVVCYVGAWSYYRTCSGKFFAENVDTSLCSHIMYSFAVLDANTYEMKSHDSWLDIDLKGYTSYTDLKNSDTKVMLALGGWTDSSGSAGDKYEKMAGDPTLRAKFVSSAVTFLKKYNFDGLDVDWEYPTNKDTFSQLIRDLRTALNAENLLLSIAIGAGETTIENGYDFGVLCDNLDFINLMTYDFHGSWESVTGHHTDFRRLLSTYRFLKKKNACIDKMTLGMASYGRSFRLTDPSNNSTGAPASGGGEMGPFTEDPGYLGYNEYCTERASYSMEYNKLARSYVAVKGTTWLGIDTRRTIRNKSVWARKRGFKGGMMWSIETDDFRGYCYKTTYALLRVINQQIYK